MPEINIISLNANNFKANSEYIKEITQKNHIIYLNELWLHQHEEKLIKDILPVNKKLHFKSAMDDSYKQGRPFGGQAWIIDDSLPAYSVNFMNNNISALTISTPQFNELKLIGVYLPHFNGDVIRATEFSSLLKIAETILREAHINRQPSICFGDFNADPNRYTSNTNDDDLRNFLAKPSSTLISHLFTQPHPHTYSNIKNSARIDHIICNESALKIINKCNTIEDAINTSDHLAVTLTITDHSLPKKVMKSATNTCPESYYAIKLLSNNEIALEYNKSIEHDLTTSLNANAHTISNPSGVESLYKLLINTIKRAANATLLRTTTHQRLPQVAWNQELTEMKKHVKSIRIERNNCFCQECQDQYKQSKRLYRQMQRQNHYQQTILVQQNICSLASKRNKNECWEYIAKVRNNWTSLPTPDIPIAILISHYETQFQIVEHHDSNRNTLINDHLKNLLVDSENRHDNSALFTVDQLKVVIKHLNPTTGFDSDGINSILIKHIRAESFLLLLTHLFNKMVELNYIPVGLNHSQIVPILKNATETTSLKNIRPISISNALAQIFEAMLLNANPRLNNVEINQFGFRKNSSCNHAIFALKETIANYIEKQSNCYVAFLDAEKAFDKVWRRALYTKIHSRMLPQHWRALVTYYESSTANIKLCNEKSEMFKINCGVKQGGILSPTLFSIYMNDLIKEIIKSNTGAICGSANTSILAYADDLALITQSHISMQELLNTCSRFGDHWCIKFNSNKSKVMRFEARKKHFKSPREDGKCKLYLGGEELEMVNSFKYLGLEITHNLKDDLTIINNFKKISKAVYSLSYLGLGRSNTNMNSNTLSFLYKSLCLPKGIYALENMSLSEKTINKGEVLQNNIIRNLFKLGKYCHMTNILKSLKILNFRDLITKTKINFVEHLNKNIICKQIFNHKLSTWNEHNNSTSLLKDISHIKKIRKDEQTLSKFIENDMKQLKTNILKNLHISNGIADSLSYCLSKKNNKFYKNLLTKLTYTDFYSTTTRHNESIT